MDAKTISQILNLFPEVEWDRWGGEIVPADCEIAVFGWLQRKDDRRDFVFIRIDDRGPWMIATSSAKYSADFSRRINFHNHNDCKPVAGYFAVRTI